MEIVGFSGYARAGKDTAAEVLIKEFGFTKIAFADKLREVLYALNPVVGFRTYPAGGMSNKLLKDVIDDIGWESYKESEYGPEIRRLIQRMGTEAGRNILGQNIWVDSAFTNVESDARIVITDVRFPNEAQAVVSRGGMVIRINKTGNSPANSHPSENALDDWPFNLIVENHSTLDVFKDKIRNLAWGWGY